MIAAVYARKSTEQNGVSDEAKSVTRQIEHACAFAEAKGWVVDEAHVYQDDGISGAEFENRPGLQAMLAALKPKPPFQVLVMSEDSRLGREQSETAYLIKRLLTAGVQIFTYLDGQEVTVRNSTDKILRSVRGYASEVEREQSGSRVHDSFKRKFLAGHVVGGRLFGYRNVDVEGQPDKDGRRRRLHVVRQINEQEAAVVRRIFELCASGKGFKRIAITLNHEGAPAPPPSTGGRRGVPLTRAWAASTVREIIHREIYRGVLIWNRVKKRDQWGLKAYRPRAQTEWLRLEQPELRIVDEALWHAAHERLSATRATYLRNTKGQVWGRPASGIESRYLLTGLLQCGLCGGSLVVASRDMKKRRRHVYACSNNRFRGSTVCANNLWAPLETADREILGAIGRDLLRSEVVSAALTQALETLRPSTEANSRRRATLEAELGRLDQEIARLTEAIAAGGDLAPLVLAMRGREQRRAEVAGELSLLARVRQMSGAELGRLQDDLQAHLADWQSLLRAAPVQGRQILRKLLVGRLTFTPRTSGGERYYEYAGEATLGRLLAGAFGSARAMVTPASHASPSIPLRGLLKVA